MKSINSVLAGHVHLKISLKVRTFRVRVGSKRHAVGGQAVALRGKHFELQIIVGSTDVVEDIFRQLVEVSLGIAGQVLLGSNLISDNSKEQVYRGDALLAVDYEEFFEFGRSHLLHNHNRPEKVFDIIEGASSFKLLD